MLGHLLNMFIHTTLCNQMSMYSEKASNMQILLADSISTYFFQGYASKIPSWYLFYHFHKI